MISQPLSRLEQIDLKDVWSHEASSFTPWLALEQNIALLGETLGLELEVEAQRKQLVLFGPISCARTFRQIRGSLSKTN
jgi:hypothetical protein